jgi:hypothetical protein
VDSVGVLKADPDDPDVFGLQRRLLADQLAFVPRFMALCGGHGRLPQMRRESDCVARLGRPRKAGGGSQPAEAMSGQGRRIF